MSRCPDFGSFFLSACKRAQVPGAAESGSGHGWPVPRRLPPGRALRLLRPACWRTSPHAHQDVALMSTPPSPGRCRGHLHQHGGRGAIRQLRLDHKMPRLVPCAFARGTQPPWREGARAAAGDGDSSTGPRLCPGSCPGRLVVSGPPKVCSPAPPSSTTDATWNRDNPPSEPRPGDDLWAKRAVAAAAAEPCGGRWLVIRQQETETHLGDPQAGVEHTRWGCLARRRGARLGVA